MQASQITKGMQVMTGTKGYRKVLSVQPLHRTVILILSGGIYMTPLKNEDMQTLPARDAKGRFMARVYLVLSYCAELGEIVTTHIGRKSAHLAARIHKTIWPNGSAVVA